MHGSESNHASKMLPHLILTIRLLTFLGPTYAQDSSTTRVSSHESHSTCTLDLVGWMSQMATATTTYGHRRCQKSTLCCLQDMYKICTNICTSRCLIARFRPGSTAPFGPSLMTMPHVSRLLPAQIRHIWGARNVEEIARFMTCADRTSGRGSVGFRPVLPAGKTGGNTHTLKWRRPDVLTPGQFFTGCDSA